MANQVLWAVLAVSLQQWGLLVGVAVYVVVFTRNGVRWTREHRQAPPRVVGPARPPVYLPPRGYGYRPKRGGSGGRDVRDLPRPPGGRGAGSPSAAESGRPARPRWPHDYE